MTQAIGWILIIATLICIGSPFVTWWKLRKIKGSLDQISVDVEEKMPRVSFFGSYRKGLAWARKYQNELPKHIEDSINQAFIFDRLAIIAFVILILVAAFSAIYNS